MTFGVIVLLIITLLIKNIRTKPLFVILTYIVLIILCGLILPLQSFKFQDEYLRKNTDSDSIQIGATFVVTFGYWWLTLVITCVIYGITLWLLNKKLSPKNYHKKDTGIIDGK